MKTIRDNIGKILEQYPDTKDSDTKLFAKYMNIYCDVWLTIEQVTKMLKWPSYASIIRERSRYQNTLKQYQASEKIKKQRWQKQSEYRNRYWPAYKEDVL